MKLAAAFFHEALSLKILHQRVDRLVRHAHRARYISDPQLSGIENSRQYLANSVGFDRRALRLGTTRGLVALRMIESGVGDAIDSGSPQSIGHFDESADQQALQYPVNHAV